MDERGNDKRASHSKEEVQDVKHAHPGQNSGKEPRVCVRVQMRQAGV